MRITRFVAVALLLLSVIAELQGSARSQDVSAAPQKVSPKMDEEQEGEKRFQTNCGRCHHPPEALSPREARTVVRQMRVRAMLSAEDERLILKFLAP